MNYIDEWHLLVQDLRLHIAQEYPDLVVTTKSAVKPAPVKQALPPVIPKAVQELPKKQAPLPSQPKPKVKEPEIPKTPLEPIMQALARPFTKPAPISLLDCIERFEKIGIHTIDAPKEPKAEEFCQLAMVSFFSPGSEEQKFIQKVAASVTERIIPCGIYSQPGLTAAAECFTLAAAHQAKALILAYSQEDMPKLATWLTYFGDDLQPQESSLECLASKRTLFGVPLYELVVTATTMTDSASKRTLWNDIQKISA